MPGHFARECRELAERCLTTARAANRDDVEALEWIVEMLLSLAARAERKSLSNVIPLRRAGS